MIWVAWTGIYNKDTYFKCLAIQQAKQNKNTFKYIVLKVYNPNYYSQLSIGISTQYI